MSELTTAARPYAKAVFEMAQASGSLAEWSGQLAAMSAVVATEGSVALLSNPRMSKAQKAEIFSDIIGDGLTQGGRNLLMTLGENDRFVLIPEIASLYEAMKAEAEGAVEAELVAARKLTEKQEGAITEALRKRLGREVKLVTSVDPSLMGGAIVRTGDLVIDGSIRSRLQGMKMAMAR
ncbi:MAG: F0F1 ATP synthase subunit delta [Thiothrix nivea]|nr:MAG: F0F1 ATP synthase subunit delta [Thiothrix nivea]